MSRLKRTEAQKKRDALRLKIIHTLLIYPIISPAMLQAGIGPTTKAKFWRPILDELIEEGKISRTTETSIAPNGRYNQYTLLRLTISANERKGMQEEMGVA